MGIFFFFFVLWCYSPIEGPGVPFFPIIIFFRRYLLTLSSAGRFLLHPTNLFGDDLYAQRSPGVRIKLFQVLVDGMSAHTAERSKSTFLVSVQVTLQSNYTGQKSKLGSSMNKPGPGKHCEFARPCSSYSLLSYSFLRILHSPLILGFGRRSYATIFPSIS